MRVAVCVVLLVVVVTAWHRVQAPWWDNAGDLREMQDNMASGAGYEGTDEYTPAGADASVTSKEVRRVIVDGPARAAIHVFQWNAESKMFTAEMSAPAKLALRLFNYPAWHVVVNGRAVRAETGEGTGQMLVPVERGANRVEIEFMRTWDRSLGFLISVMALLLMLILGRGKTLALLQRSAA